MSTFYIVIYLVSFCLLVGCGFAMMYANIRSIQEDMNRPIKKHPEAPEPGEQVMYVDVSQDSAADFEARKKQLEDLYND